MHSDLPLLRERVRKFSAAVQDRLPVRIASAEELHRIAGRAAELLRVEIIGLASRLKCPPLQVTRNLVATANAEGVKMIRDLLVFLERESPFEPASEHRALVSELPSPGRRTTMCRWMLLGGRLPARSAAFSCFGGNLHQILDFERVVMRNLSDSPSSSADTIAVLRALSSKDHDKLHEDSWEVLSSEGFAKGLAPLDEEAFQRLSQRVRQWILENREFSESALTSDFYHRIWSGPLAFQDTPDSIEEKNWVRTILPAALRALSSRTFYCSEVETLLHRQDFDEYSDQILRALQRRASTTYCDPSRMPLELPDTGVATENTRVIHALSFFSKPVEQRLSVAEDLSEEDIKDLAVDVTKKDWTKALQECSASTALTRVRSVVLADQGLRSALMKILHDSNTSLECLQTFARDYFEDADARGLWKLVSQKLKVLELCQIDDLMQPQFRELIQIHGSKPAGFCTLLNRLSHKFSRHLFSSDEPWLQEWRHDVSQVAARSRSIEFRRLFLLFSLQHSPDLIESAFTCRVTRADFDYLAGSTLRGDKAARHQGLLQLVDARNTPHWENHLRKGKRTKKLKQLIRSTRPELLPRVEEIEVESLLRDASLKRKLRKVLHGKAPARSIELPPRILPHFIPWVRKTWIKKPTVAAAYELALAFSIRDAQYLLFLCSERWKSRERDRGGFSFDNLYHTYPLPKKSGGTRLVTAPDDRLKRLQRRILRNGFDQEFIHPSAHGFKRGRSILTNAQIHVRQPCVVNVDIKAFFPNTSHKNILRACSYLQDGKLSDGAKRVLADICSYGGGLPTGAPTSPAIANLVLRSADTSIAKAAKVNGINYTRYADDLTFSGESNVLQILPFVTKVLSQLGYCLDPKKTNIFRRGRRQIVTGLVVNEKPNLPRRIRRRLRAAVHQRSNGEKTHWHGRPMSGNELMGRLAMLQLVQPEEAKALKHQLVSAASS